MFWPPPAEWYEKIAFVCVASIAFRTSYAIYDVSQNSLISLLPQTPRERPALCYGQDIGFLGRPVVRLSAHCVGFDSGARSVRRHEGDGADRASGDRDVLRPCAGGSRFRPPNRRAGLCLNGPHCPFRHLKMPIFAIMFQVGFLGLISRLLPLYGHGEAGYAQSSALVMAMVCGTVIGPPVASMRSARAGTRTAAADRHGTSPAARCSPGWRLSFRTVSSISVSLAVHLRRDVVRHNQSDMGTGGASRDGACRRHGSQDRRASVRLADHSHQTGDRG